MAQKVIRKTPQQTQTPAANLTGIPTQMKLDFERRSGLSLDDVRVHYHSQAPARLGALAYTQGTQVHIGPGQERHMPHELGHVVQQKLGLVRPTGYRNGVAINDAPGLEQAADAGILPAPGAAGKAIQPVVQCSQRSNRQNQQMPAINLLLEEDSELEDYQALAATLPVPAAPAPTTPPAIIPARPTGVRPKFPVAVPLPDSLNGPLVRHHLIPASDLWYLFELVGPGGIAFQSAKFFPFIIGIAEDFKLMPELTDDERKEMDRLIQVCEKAEMDRSDLESILRLFVWNPLNWVIGPQERANDPKNEFDEEALLAMHKELGKDSDSFGEIDKNFRDLHSKMHPLLDKLDQKARKTQRLHNPQQANENAEDIRALQDCFDMMNVTFVLVRSLMIQKNTQGQEILSRKKMEKTFEPNLLRKTIMDAVSKTSNAHTAVLIQVEIRNATNDVNRKETSIKRQVRMQVRKTLMAPGVSGKESKDSNAPQNQNPDEDLPEGLITRVLRKELYNAFEKDLQMNTDSNDSSEGPNEIKQSERAAIIKTAIENVIPKWVGDIKIQETMQRQKEKRKLQQAEKKLQQEKRKRQAEEDSPPNKIIPKKEYNFPKKKIPKREEAMKSTEKKPPPKMEPMPPAAPDDLDDDD